MATDVVNTPSKTVTAQAPSGIFSGRTGRKLLENLTAYIFLTPALLVIFTFGIFPILFAAYVSLYKWRILQNEYRGLENYVNAMGDIAYLFFFVIGVALISVGGQSAYKAYNDAQDSKVPTYFLGLALIPASIITFGMAQVILSFITFFAQDDAIAAGEAAKLGSIPLGIAAIVIGLVANVALNSYQHKKVATHRLTILPNFGTPAVATILSVGLGLIIIGYTFGQLRSAENYSEAISHIFQLIVGLIPIIIGYFLWTWASRQANNVRLFSGLAVSAALIGIGIFLVVSDWSEISAGSSEDFYLSLIVTVFYSVFTVPFQLGIAMILAYLLFQNIAAKGLFRIIFFIPYIAPAVATAGIFQALFSQRETSLANRFIGALGGEPNMRWLGEAASAVSAFGETFGIEGAADWAIGGPSLALFVIILYNIWVYVGYDTVIFLAGLGNIPNTLYEAAKIDGAGRWALFRHITFPLLSPTTYFLSVISIIGTFRAFNHIWILRLPAAQGTADTASIHFFETFLRQSRFGYSTSMAMVLFVVILVLYLIQQRIARTRVFYG